ncbi:hypothetical protein B566_EDAN005924 [Ephemera danica]|nr:hypothetical protein B566_EDAN005924 [Ephemera danica]
MALPGRPANSPRSKEEVLRLAKEFLDQYFLSIRRLNSPAHVARWAQVSEEVETGGAYQLTGTELTFGAKLAWRNSVRCIGRIQWSKLQREEKNFRTPVKYAKFWAHLFFWLQSFAVFSLCSSFRYLE